jgi:SAM-dependent methyltransferase
MNAASQGPSESVTSASAEEEITSELWGRAAREKSETDEWTRFYWQSHPLTLRHINRLVTGDESVDWLSFTKRRFFTEAVERGLSLGCGHGTVEREAINLDLCRTFDALDISEEALEVARRDAERAGLGEQIDYRREDLNSVQLAEGAYDIVFAVQVLHHVDALEHLLDEVVDSLRRDGLFVVNEYVGPARFQWLDKTQAVMNRILDLLPEEYKVNPRNGYVKERIERAPADEIARVDPSESIRSDEIRELLRSRFDVRYHADFGGTINQFLLADIAANFRDDDPKDVAILDLISLLEEELVAARVLPSDFAFFVLSPRR